MKEEYGKKSKKVEVNLEEEDDEVDDEEEEEGDEEEECGWVRADKRQREASLGKRSGSGNLQRAALIVITF